MIYKRRGWGRKRRGRSNWSRTGKRIANSIFNGLVKVNRENAKAGAAAAEASISMAGRHIEFERWLRDQQERESHGFWADLWVDTVFEVKIHLQALLLLIGHMLLYTLIVAVAGFAVVFGGIALLSRILLGSWPWS